MRRTAFRAGQISIAPPADQQVKKVKKLVDETEKFTNDSKTAGKAVDLATKAVKTVNSVLG